MKIISYLLFSILFFTACENSRSKTFINKNGQTIIDLSGEWHVRLSKDSLSNIPEQDFAKTEGMIKLPSSLAQQGYGVKTKGSDFGVLTPEYKFLGVATFERTINIPKSYEGQSLELFLERVLWESRVFIDGKPYGAKDALGTPHVHQLGALPSGKHKLTIAVNNGMIHNIGDKGHAYGAYTQGIWNGIVGAMEIRPKAPAHIDRIRVFSLLDTDQVKVEINLETPAAMSGSLSLDLTSIKNNKKLISKTIDVNFSKGKQQKIVLLDLNGKLEKWSEFNPKTYLVKAQLKQGSYSDTASDEFGYMTISQNGTHILVNGKPIFLRGNLDCVHFPLTGYPSTKVADWERIFKIYKEYGLNHARFHSWCPPEAAFIAANRVGIYLQAEASIWIDWWMSADMKKRGRPEMDTKGKPKGLGRDPKRDKFVIAEMNRMVDFYGNNPSFSMFCIGNELGNTDFDVAKTWVRDLKNKDPRRLYSVSTARKITDVDDYMATHSLPNVGATRGLRGARTNWDFENVYSKANIPIIAHEIGQWPVYPSWDEIKKYTGVFKARNFEEFKALAEKNGISHQNEDLKNASGALNQIMYKYETESFLRTRSCAGVQLLSMQDYQGQGEALIGWLDAFWDSKGITTPKDFREHFSETVPLLRMDKFVWKTHETYQGQVQLFHYGEKDLENKDVILKIETEKGSVLYEKKWHLDHVKRGSLIDVSDVRTDVFHTLKKAQELNVSIAIPGTPYRNHWNIWVFPETLPEIKSADIMEIDVLDSKTLEQIKSGKKALLVANNLGDEKHSVKVGFYPLYWSSTFFPGQDKMSLGMLLKDTHPALKDFPTTSHSDWQWEPFNKGSKGFVLNELPKAYEPIVQIVDDFHRSNKEGIVFEFKIGAGKLLVCGFDLNTNPSPVAKQLKYSLIRYMTSDAFNPTQTVSDDFLKKIFTYIPKSEKVVVPEVFDNPILYVEAAKNLTVKNKNMPWKSAYDVIKIKGKKVDYKPEIDAVWSDQTGHFWTGKNMTVTVNCPEGILGTFYVLLDDPNHKNREGIITFEGRKVRLGKHDTKGGRWVKFHVMREDSNDGKLKLQTEATKGGNLMIRKIVLEKK